MNEKEISEIRRRFRADKSNITHVRGCYVNEKQEIVSQFDQPLSLLPQEECENMLSVLRRTLSGTLGKNLIEMPFTTAQVIDSDEHRLLMALRDSKLTDEEAVQMFFEKVIASYRPEGTYLILLANDTYDVPYRAKDGETLEDASENIYNYVLCTVCPVKQTKRFGVRRAGKYVPQPRHRLACFRAAAGLFVPVVHRPQRRYLQRHVLLPQRFGKLR